MKKIRINYFNNKLDFHNISSNKYTLIDKLWIELRENYTDWVVNFEINTSVNGESILKSLKWRGMSTWWLNQLTTKDVEHNNQWVNRIMILYLCRDFDCRIHTDDKILISCLKKNQSKLKTNTVNGLNVFYSKSSFSHILLSTRVIKIFHSIFRCLKISTSLIGMRKLQDNLIKQTRPTVWFRSGYPGNWITNKSGEFMDRHIRGAPLLDVKFNQITGYLPSVILYENDLSKGGQLSLWKELRSLSKKSGRTVVYPEAYLSLIDYIEIYYDTFLEYLKFNKWKKSPVFIKLFHINNLDLSDILIDTWESSYFSSMQYNKLVGLSIVRFLEAYKEKVTIVSYEEFLPHIRYAYFKSKDIHNGNIFIALQHAHNCKNKMPFYYHFKETNYGVNNKSLNMPTPDYYLAQGVQYKRLLDNFYDKNRSKVIGCLKYDNFVNIQRKKVRIRREIINKYNIKNKNIILLSPSVNDIESILHIVSLLKNDPSTVLLLTAHPAVDINKMKSLHNAICPELNIRFITEEKTEELYTVASIVVCGYSTVAIEAAFFGIQPVRALLPGVFPLFETDDLVPCFYSPEQFNSWYKDFDNHNIEKDKLKLMAERCFYKIDGMSGDRLWNFISNRKDTYEN